MFVTAGLYHLAHRVALKAVRDEMERKKEEIREALAIVENEDDEVVRNSAADELVDNYKRALNPHAVSREVIERRGVLLTNLDRARPNCPMPPVPPVPANTWALTVVDNDRSNFDRHMAVLARNSFQVACLETPGSEFATQDNMKDPYYLGLARLDERRYPNACRWGETRAAFRADKERVERGWTMLPDVYAATCWRACVKSCALALGISEPEMEANLPQDLKEFWKEHERGDYEKRPTVTVRYFLE